MWLPPGHEVVIKQSEQEPPASGRRNHLPPRERVCDGGQIFAALTVENGLDKVDHRAKTNNGPTHHHTNTNGKNGQNQIVIADDGNESVANSIGLEGLHKRTSQSASCGVWSNPENMANSVTQVCAVEGIEMKL